MIPTFRYQIGYQSTNKNLEMLVMKGEMRTVTHLACKTLTGFKGFINRARALGGNWAVMSVHFADSKGKIQKEKVMVRADKIAKITGLKKSEVKKLISSGDGIAKLEARLHDASKPIIMKTAVKSSKKVNAKKGSKGNVKMPPLPKIPGKYTAKNASLMGSGQISTFKSSKGNHPKNVSKLKLSKMKPTKTKTDQKGHLHLPSRVENHD